ncbi:MAG: RHS repeat-associated core domain-containing protein [Pseudomonadota bacterium]|jgi:RHS repeat-associated protein
MSTRIREAPMAPSSMTLTGNLTDDGARPRLGRRAAPAGIGATGTGRNTSFRHRRTRKETTAAAPQGAATVLYTYDGNDHLLAETDAGGPIRSYLWRDDTPVAQIEHRPTRRVQYLETDHLNTPRAARNEAGTVVWRWEADAFGSSLPDEDPDGDGQSITVNLRYPGQYFDPESGLHYNQARYYDPSTGRYLSPDPIGLAGGLNTYSYVGGNPLSFMDPLGLECTAQNGSVSCNVPGGPQIRFPQPSGWPSSMKPGDSNYHYYNKWVNLPPGIDKKCIEDYFRNHPTPGSPKPATLAGTANNASPGWAAPFKSSPVVSYSTSYNGSPVIVNVTIPGHPLFPGYVARTVDGGVANNFGEGTG